jgi:hypothetical protein
LQVRHAVVEQRFDLAEPAVAAERKPRFRTADIGDKDGGRCAQNFTSRR